MIYRKTQLAILSTAILLLFAVLSCAQNLVSVSDAEGVQTTKTVLTSRIRVGGVDLASVVTEGEESEPVTSTIKLVTINTDAANVRVSVEDENRNDATKQFGKISAKQYASKIPGTYWFRVLAVDFEKNIFDEQTVKVVVEGSPTPPIPPDDNVDNTYGLGAIASATAPQHPATRALVAERYRQAGDFLFGIPTLKSVSNVNGSQNNVFTWLNQQADAMQCPDPVTCQQWKTFRTEIAKAFVESQKNRQYTRQDWYNALNEIAKAIQ